MRIDQVILSSTPGSFYLSFWPIVANAWQDLMGIEPILIYVPDDGATISEKHGEVIRLPYVAGVPDDLHANWARYWITQRWPEKISILSDIDMLPLSRQYFVDKLAHVPDTAYVHLNPDEPVRLPTCYHVAKGWNYRDVLGLDEKFETSLQSIVTYWKPQFQAKPVVFWGTVEYFASERLKLCKHYEPIKRTEGRIDRANWHYDVAELEKYADAHLLRPYHQYHVEIDRLDADIRQHYQSAKTSSSASVSCPEEAQ